MDYMTGLSRETRTGAAPTQEVSKNRALAAASHGASLKNFGHKKSEGSGGETSVSVNGEPVNSSHIDLKVTVGFDQQYNLTAMVKSAIGVPS